MRKRTIHSVRRIYTKLLILLMFVSMGSSVLASVYWTVDGESVSEIIMLPDDEVIVQISSDNDNMYDFVVIGPSDGTNYEIGDAAKIIDVKNLPGAAVAATFVDWSGLGYPGWWNLQALTAPGMERPVPGEQWDITIKGMALGTENFSSDWYEDMGPDAILTVIVSQGYTLTIQTEPNDIGIDSIIPGVGQTQSIGLVDINAEPFADCPDVYYFDHWDGDVAEPNLPATTVLLNEDKTITAVYTVGQRLCGDLCHPIMVGDLNNDCRVNMLDFVLYTEKWLSCTHPDCD